MRKQSRSAALVRGLGLAAGLAAAGLTGGVSPAGAHPVATTRAAPTAANLAALRQCESSGSYTINTGNGYYGAYQFSSVTWWSLGYKGLPHQAPPAVQDEAAARLHAIAGWAPWPGCTRALGLR